MLSQLPLDLLSNLSTTHPVSVFSDLLGQTRIYYQWSRFEQLDQWWHYLLVLLAIIAVIGHVVWWYKRDSVEQQRPVRWALLLLRIVVFVGLILYFFQLDKRSELRVTRNSRVAILVDTSLSMSLPGTPAASGVANTQTRAEEAAQLVSASPVLGELAAQHDVTVYRFDQATRPAQVASLARPTVADTTNDSMRDTQLLMLSRAHTLMLAACFLGIVGLLLICVSFTSQVLGARNWSGGGWSLFSGSVLSLAAMLIAAFAVLPASDYPLEALFVSPEEAIDRFKIAANDSFAPQLNPTSASEADQARSANQLPGDWQSALAPSGIETRMGDAIKAVLDREQGSPLAGIVIVTDGRSNAGLDPKSLILAAQNQRVPLYFVGVGSEKNPPNIQLVEVDAPKRIYPGDKFTLNALLQSSGFAGKAVTVQVTAGAKGADPSTYQIEAEQTLNVTTDDELLTAQFELEPRAVGSWTYNVRLIPLAGDMDSRDDSQATEVAVIERKNRVLIFAGGPSREYQFVRNLLFRDRDVESHILLQSANKTVSQEASKILTEFPADRAALSEYDAILAFDADWTKVSDEQVKAIEQWVAEQAGGLLLVAGNVEMPKWLSRNTGGERSKLLRTLSPVVLVQSGRSTSGGRIEAEKSWPIKLTNDGKQTDFLWLSDDPATSTRLWDDFEGVYSFSGAFDLKPGAKKLAVFSDPSAADGDQNLPIYLASHFYGAGRVVYQGGGEMWRIRELGDMYFDRYYTKLVRWLSGGRLLLDSDRGILLVDRETALLGDQVTVRAVLKDKRFQPLVQSEVMATLMNPKKQTTRLILRPLGGGTQPGVYTAQFPVQIAGDYTIQLELDGLGSGQILQASVKSRVPAVEMQSAERNDALLAPLAAQTGGRYFKGASSAVEATGSGTTLASVIARQDQVSYLPGVPNRAFQLRWLGWLMGLIAGCLTIEWFARRLHRLA